MKHFWPLQWKIIERGLMIVGATATLAGVIIAYLAFVSPAELSRTIARIADRLEAEPTLAASERHFVSAIYTSSSGSLHVVLGKEVTKSGGKATMLICSFSSDTVLAEYNYAFGAAANTLYPEFKLEADRIRIRQTIADDKQKSVTEEHWANRNGNWSLTDNRKIIDADSDSCKQI